MAKVDTPNTDSSNPYDFFVEPPWVWDAIFKHEQILGALIDPCCGSGKVLDAAIDVMGSPVFVSGADIVERGHERQLMVRDMTCIEDWVSGLSAPSYGTVASNPPFYGGKGYAQYLDLAFRLAKHKIICIGNARLPYSDSRRNLYRERRPSRIYHLQRPSMPPGDKVSEMAGKAFSGGSIDYCAFVWDLTSPTRVTETYWLSKEGELV